MEGQLERERLLVPESKQRDFIPIQSIIQILLRFEGLLLFSVAIMHFRAGVGVGWP